MGIRDRRNRALQLGRDGWQRLLPDPASDEVQEGVPVSNAPLPHLSDMGFPVEKPPVLPDEPVVLLPGSDPPPELWQA